MLVFNWTKETISQKFNGQLLSIRPGEKVELDSECARALLDGRAGNRGLVSLRYGDDERARVLIGKRKRLAFLEQTIKDEMSAIREARAKNIQISPSFDYQAMLVEIQELRKEIRSTTTAKEQVASSIALHEMEQGMRDPGGNGTVKTAPAPTRFSREDFLDASRWTDTQLRMQAKVLRADKEENGELSPIEEDMLQFIEEAAIIRKVDLEV